MKKRRMFFLRGLAWASLAVVLALAAAFVVMPDRAYSPAENRNLQQLPALTFRGATSGRFEQRFERYVNDQFPLRDMWIAVKSSADRLLGRVASEGVFLGRDGYLIQDFTPPSGDDYRRTLNALRAFAARHADLPQYLLAAPTAVTVLADKLPAGALPGDEPAYLDRLSGDLAGSGIAFVDVREALARAAADMQVYYRTDHHWTTDGARAAYLRFAEMRGLRGANAVYRRALLSNAFRGTLSAMSGLRTREVDDLYVCLPENGQPQYVVTNPATGERSASLYRTAALDARDQYAVFLGGNAARLDIETTVDGGRCLLVLKDSYANCFIPFLLPDYGKLIVVDPRYFTDDLDVLIGAEGVDEVLFLYNAATLAADASLWLDVG